MKRHQIQYLMKSRVMWLFIIFISCFMFLGYRLVYISVIDQNNYKQHVLAQQISNLTDTNNQIIPKRGTIYDARGIALAQSNVIYNVIYDPAVLNELDEDKVDATIYLLSQTLEGVTAEDLRELLVTRSMSSYEIIARGLNYDVIKPIYDGLNTYEIGGVAFEEQYERVYPYKTLASDVIGFLSGDNIGLWGLEHKYNDYLSGEIGRRFGALDDDQRINQEDVGAVNGYDIVLNIDFTVQTYIEEAIGRFYEEEDALSVKVITMDPRNGHVIGMASYPNYDLNDPYDTTAFLADEDKAAMTEAEVVNILTGIWKNGNVADSYEPGSTFKPLTFAMALEEYQVDPEMTFYCSGSKIPFEGEDPIHCWKHSGHGEQTLTEALSNSCNVAFMEIGELVGRDYFYNYQHMFGIGAVTGIDLTSEASYRSTVYGYDQLNPVELQTSSFGQGFNVTPIQLITAFSAVINGGNLYQPQVVNKVTSEDGLIIEVKEPVVQRKVISEEVSNITRDALKVVVDDGTGRRAQVEGYSIGGKTGTAEKNDRESEDYIVSFIGFSPVVDPEVITLVVVDDPVGENVNSRYAAALFKDIMKDVLPYLRVPREYDPEESSELSEAEVAEVTESQEQVEVVDGE